MIDITDFIGVFIGSMLFIALSTLVALQYRKQKSLALILYAAGWCFMGFYFLFVLVAQDELSFRINETFCPPLAMLFLLTFVDYSMKDSFGWKKLALSFSVTGIFIGYLLNSATVVALINGTFWVVPSFAWLWLDNIVFMIPAITLTYWAAFLYLHVGEKLRRTTANLLVASVFLILSVIFTTIYSMTSDSVSSFLSYVCLVIGSMITSIVLYRHPAIVAILPYQVYRIIIMSKGKNADDSGRLLYEYNGTMHEIKTKLLASVLSAFMSTTAMFMNLVEVKDKENSNINDNMLMAGMIKEIRLDKATILINSRHAVTFALLASRSSINLTSSFDKFINMTIQYYKSDLYGSDGTLKDIRSNLFSTDTVNEFIRNSFPMFR